MRLGLLGGSGQVGAELQRLAAERALTVLAPASSAVDITDREAVRDWVDSSACDVYVNCAAYTAVDAAERDADLAHAVNGSGAGHVADAVASSSGRLVHISTDYVFDGEKPEAYTEDDPVSPLNVYGASKLAGEEAVARSGAKHAVLRVSWVFGVDGHNFVKSILRKARADGMLRVVDDQHGAPCSAASIARAALALAAAPEWRHRLYHFGAVPQTTWHGFAEAIVSTARDHGLLDGPVPVERIHTASLDLPALRPANSAMNTQRLESEFGALVADWRDELDAVLEHMARVGFDR